MKDLFGGQTYDLKTRVDIWTRMNVVPERTKKTDLFILFPNPKVAAKIIVSMTSYS